MKPNDHGLCCSKVNVSAVLYDGLRRSGFQSGLSRTLRHGTRHCSHWANTDEVGRSGHTLRDLWCVVQQSDRLKRISEVGLAVHVFLENSSLPHDFGSSSLKLAATDAENRFSMSESPVDSFLRHG